MCLNIGTHKNINFSFETNGKLMALGVPILKHFKGSHLTPNQQSQTPIFGLQENSTKLHDGTPTFLKKCPWDSCFENPSENPAVLIVINAPALINTHTAFPKIM